MTNSINSFQAILLVLLLMLVSVAKAEPFLLEDNLLKMSLTNHIEYNVSYDSHSLEPPVEGWSELSSFTHNFGFSKTVHWFRYSIKNNTTLPSAALLEIASPLLDNISIYTLREGVVINSQHLGDSYPFSERPFFDRTFIVPLSFLPNEELEYYISIKSKGLVDAPIYLWSPEYFHQTRLNEQKNIGMLLGLLLAVIIASLIVAVKNRNPFFLYTGLLLFNLTLIYLSMSGLAFNYLWPNYPVIQNLALPLTISLSVIFACLAERVSLVTQFGNQYLINGLSWLLIVACLMPFSLFISYQLAIYLGIFLALFTCIYLLIVATLSWREGIYDHNELNISLISLLVIVLIIATGVIFNLTSTVTLANLFLYGLSLQGFLILIDTYKHREPITEIEFSEEDAELSNKMFELQEALRELEDKNAQLEKLSTLDALSGINNRRHFDKRLLAELRRARREQHVLSLIIFDIDHFKKINDTYGHLAGDEVIRTVAHIGQLQLHRPSDAIFRYGGEEFAIILPTTDLKGAAEVAQKIRLAIEETKITHQEKVIQCTVSAGAACYDYEHPFDVNDIIERADSNLYNAKQTGRNRVVI